VPTSLVYGSPWSARFYDWAFNVDRGPDSDRLYAHVPDETDVLITHGPPLGRGDLTSSGGRRAGCADLLRHVQDRIRPRLHAFGHIHECGGEVSYDGTTLYVNASSVDPDYRVSLRSPYVVVDLPDDRAQPARVVKPQCRIVTPHQFVEWLRTNGYGLLATYCDENLKAPSKEPSRARPLPSGDGFVSDGERAYVDVCDALLLHRDARARAELRDALLRLYAESFSQA